jgi:hypothetical protein
VVPKGNSVIQSKTTDKQYQSACAEPSTAQSSSSSSSSSSSAAAAAAAAAASSSYFSNSLLNVTQPQGTKATAMHLFQNQKYRTVSKTTILKPSFRARGRL